MRRGLAAADLLANEAFTSTIRSLMFECYAQFTESKPEGSAQREDMYHFYRGLKAIEAELLGRVHAKDAIEDRLNAENADQDPDNILGD